MITFFNEDFSFNLKHKVKTKSWLKKVAELEGFRMGNLNYIFCSDNYLHQINVEYLDHDTLTDIITFDNSEEEETIEGDIFVSVERVEDNAKDLNVQFDDEILRVLAHGLLHLCGYDDHTDEEEAEMRVIESKYIQLFRTDFAK